MARTEKRGAGMTERVVEVPETWQEELASWKRFTAQLPVAHPDDMLGDAMDRENAARCRAILAAVGLADLMDGQGAVDLGPLRDKKLDEDSAQWIAAEWLAAYNRLRAHRRKLVAGDVSPENIGAMLIHAQDMGRLQERMWWRAGIDPVTGERRERLAVERRNHRRAFAEAKAERQVVNAERHEAGRALAELAQNLAAEIWRRNSALTKIEVARRVAARWPSDCGIKRPTANTIRQRINRD